MFCANFAGGIPRLFHLIWHAAQLKRQCWPLFTFYSSSMIDVISTKIFRQNNNCSSFFQNFPLHFPLRQRSRSLIKHLNESRSLINQAPNVCSFQGLRFSWPLILHLRFSVAPFHCPKFLVAPMIILWLPTLR